MKNHIYITKKLIFCMSISLLLAGCSKQQSAGDKDVSLIKPSKSTNAITTDILHDNTSISNNLLIPDTSSVSENSTVTGNASLSENNILSENKLVENTMNSSNKYESLPRITYAEGFYHEPINDSVKERIYGLSYKEDCTIPYEDLRYVSVLYMDFNMVAQTGEIICNKAIADDLTEIFYQLFQAQYQIEKIRLIDEYQADDTLSITDNNTSCFNYRLIEGTDRMSKHALGAAIDINPFFNPYVTYPNGGIRISPIGSEAFADRNAVFPHKIDYNDLCYQLFTAHGFSWGGDWKSLKDYQHFEKKIK